jgi:DNA-binding CsgD family transcriptional regulator
MAIDEARRAAQLIADIYDASLDPTAWPGVLGGSCEFVRGSASILARHGIGEPNVGEPNVSFYFSFGDTPAYALSYLETYARIDPLLPPLLRQACPGGVFADSDLVPLADYVASRFYREWAKPQGYRDRISAILDKTETSLTALTIARCERDGPVDAETRRRFGLLAPHFRRAAAVARTIVSTRAEPAMLAATLDELAAGIFLVDAEARIVHANASGRVLLADCPVLKAGAERLICVDLKADRLLKAACSSTEADAGVPSKRLLLGSPDAGHWVLEVLQLKSDAHLEPGVMPGAVAAILISKAEVEFVSPLQSVGDLYRLTPGERRVLEAIVEIGGVPQVATMLGLSRRTVKTHLESLFRKTKATRQAELVRRVTEFVSPWSAWTRPDG